MSVIASGHVCTLCGGPTRGKSVGNTRVAFAVFCPTCLPHHVTFLAWAAVPAVVDAVPAVVDVERLIEYVRRQVGL